jgi:uncharacterized repeat protein (TIGR02543 family)
MSTTNYSASLITQRNRDKAIAQRIKQDTDAGKPIIVPQAGYGSYLLGEATNGTITYFKKVQGCTDINLSCNCTGSTPVTTSAPAPAPSRPPRLTYDGNGNTGGVVPARPADYASGTQVTVLGNPDPPNSLVQIGYQFAGWNTAADGSGTSYIGGDTFTITQDTTLWAQWTPAAPVTLSYNGNGSTTGSVPASPTAYAYGTTVVVLGNTGSPPLEKTGYQFTGWNTAANGSGTSYVVNNIFNITQNTTLYAQWTSTVPPVALTYDGNGNTNTSVLPPTDTNSPYVVGSTVTVLGNPISPNSLLRTGYQFAGWNTAADGSGTSYIGGNTFAINAATTLHAQWLIQNSPRLIYSAGTGGTGTAPSSSGTSYTSYSSVDIVNSTFTNTNGYTFGGWNTAADGSGTSYPPGSEYTMPGSGTVTLYAQWINPATTYNLTYDANAAAGGSGTSPNSPNPTTYNSNAAATILGNTGPYTNSDTNKIFYGWNTAADGTGISYPAGTTITMNANKILYAQWVSATPQYTVIYDANGATGGSVPAPPTNYPSGVQVPILGQGSITRPGYTFLGWNSSPSGTGSSYVSGYTFTSKTVTLYAHWAPGSSIRNCGTNAISLNGATLFIPYSQFIQSSDTITLYITALVGKTTSNYGSGLGPYGVISFSGKTIITQTNIQVFTNTTYLNSANDFNYTKTVTNIGDVTYWPAGATVSSISFSTQNKTNSTGPPTYSLATTNSFSGCGSTSISNWNFLNQTLTINFSNGTSTFIANSPNSFFYTTNGGTTFINPQKTLYPYAAYVGNVSGLPKSDNTITTITIMPSTSSTYVFPPLPDYTVEYNGNGNTGGSLPPPEFMAPYSGTASIIISNNFRPPPFNTSPYLTKSGFTFTGWNTAADGTGTNYTGGTTYNGGASLTLYAKWVQV